MKDSIKIMRKLIEKLHDKALKEDGYTQNDAIKDLYSWTQFVTDIKEATVRQECYEIRNIIDLAIMTGCFGEINNITK